MEAKSNASTLKFQPENNQYDQEARTFELGLTNNMSGLQMSYTQSVMTGVGASQQRSPTASVYQGENSLYAAGEDKSLQQSRGQAMLRAHLLEKENDRHLINIQTGDQSIHQTSLRASLHPSILNQVFQDSSTASLTPDHQRAQQLITSLAPQLYQAIIRDEIALTLQKNSVSAEFFKDRVCEIIEASLASEKEQQILNLIRELASQKEAIAQQASYLGGASQIELERAKKRLSQVPLLQEKIKELHQQLTYNQQVYGHDLAEKQADCDFKEEQVRALVAKIQKSEADLLALQNKVADSESCGNHLRRILQSIQDEKASLETKLDSAQKERERQTNLAQNLKSQHLEIQLQLQKTQSENEDLKKTLSELELEKADILSKFDQFGAHLQDQHQKQLAAQAAKYTVQTDQLENRIQAQDTRERELFQEVEQAKEMQLLIANRMKEDMRQVRDDWQALLSEKELDLKKQEAGESLRLKNAKSELHQFHQKQLMEIEMQHNAIVARLETDAVETKRSFESRLAQMICIQEHEAILNNELTKDRRLATEQLDKIQLTMQEHMDRTLQEKLAEFEKRKNQALLQNQQTLLSEKTQELDYISLKHAKELRDQAQAHQYQVQDQQQKFTMQLEDQLEVIAQLKAKLENLQVQLQSQERKIQDQTEERLTQSKLQEKIIQRLETESTQKDSDIQKFMRKAHQFETKYELLKTKMADITTNMTAQVAYTIDDLRDELQQARSGMENMASEHQQSMGAVKRIIAKINRKMAESLDEVTQERNNFEDQVDQLKQRLRTSEDRLQRVIREKRENIDVLKSDFAQVLDIAKQEVQRKYGFELKQLKRSVIHLKNKLIEEIDGRQRMISQIQLCHQQERIQQETELQRQLQQFVTNHEKKSHGSFLQAQPTQSKSMMINKDQQQQF